MKLEPDILLTHLCAAATFAYALRGAQFKATWIDVPLLDRDPPSPLPAVSVVVPARNEARSIEACVRSLCEQCGVDVEVIAIDDQSDDATPHILARLQRDYANLRVVRGAPLPEGWIGKPWAVAQAARHASHPWLLFTDADSVHAPYGVASALWFAERAKVDALTLVTGQAFESFWERAVLPSILGLILFASGTLGELNDPAMPEKALANGQYILVRRNVYDALGGHDALRGEIVEDVAFARALKRDGRYRMLLSGGSQIARVRMYHSLGEIWNGFTKNAYAGAEGEYWKLAAGVVFSAMMSVVPLALAARHATVGRRRETLEALACTFSTVAASSWAYRQVGIAPRLAIFQPLGTAIFGAIVTNSTWCVLSGRGVEWRGRRYFANG